MFGNPRDRDVVDVDLLLTEQRKEQIEWTAELRKLDDEACGVACGVTACGRRHAASLRGRGRVERQSHVSDRHVKNPLSHGMVVGSKADRPSAVVTTHRVASMAGVNQKLSSGVFKRTRRIKIP